MGRRGSEGTPAPDRGRVGSRHSLQPPLLPLLPSPGEGRGCRGRASRAPGNSPRPPPQPLPGGQAPLWTGAPSSPHPPRQLQQPPAEVRLHLLSLEGESEGCLLLGCEREKVRDHLARWARAPGAGGSRAAGLGSAGVYAEAGEPASPPLPPRFPERHPHPLPRFFHPAAHSPAPPPGVRPVWSGQNAPGERVSWPSG